MFAETFSELLNEYRLNRKQFAQQCNIPYTTVIGWTNLGRLPDFVALIKIADFFDCTIDYLCGREDEFGNIINKKEKAVIRKPDNGTEDIQTDFNKLSNNDKKIVLNLIKRLSN